MKEKASKRDFQQKLGSCRWTPQVNNKVLVKTTNAGIHKRKDVKIYVNVQGAIYYFKNISPVRLWAERLERKGKKEIQQQSFEATQRRKTA
jgi:hypothetical protein